MSKYNHHFYGANVMGWRTTDEEMNLPELILYFTRQGKPFYLYYIPKPWDISYEIIDYKPQVEGAVQLLSIYDEE